MHVRSRCWTAYYRRQPDASCSILTPNAARVLTRPTAWSESAGVPLLRVSGSEPKSVPLNVSTSEIQFWLPAQQKRATLAALPPSDGIQSRLRHLGPDGAGSGADRGVIYWNNIISSARQNGQLGRIKRRRPRAETARRRRRTAL